METIAISSGAHPTMCEVEGDDEPVMIRRAVTVGVYFIVQDGGGQLTVRTSADSVDDCEQTLFRFADHGVLIDLTAEADVADASCY